MLIPEDIGDFIAYDPDTGVLTWRVNMTSSARAGDVAGHLVTDGYLQFGFRRRWYLAHRVAWFLAKGEQPPARIDHKDLDQTNNRIDNLRPATPTQNNANWRSRTGKPKGVTVLPSGRFMAQVKCKGKNHYLGCFDTVEEAAAAYAVKAQELFGEYARAA
jgi:hypothetical protein